MPVNFPSNPSLNQTYTFTNTTWKWNGIGWEIVYNTRQTGATGATGISGAPGSPGGATGATGPAGPAGSPGGATGATGPAGTPGTIGIDGATGATGPQGPSGSPGSPGGATGATGAQGATGSPGTPGGATGATGAPGPAGSGANVAVRDEGNLVVAAVSSLNFVGAGVAATATGSNVTITISATGNSQFYYTNVAPTNATIGDRWLDSETLKEFVYADVGAGPQWIEPAGDGGFVGATGPTGAAGSQGATGATGTGATGATGTAGTPGATGATGTPGSPGTAGATGATGTAGTPGTAGATGATGTAGATGATGTAGTPGIAGATGATGIGTTGATGAQGATGPAGTSANISVFDEGNLVTASVSGINFVGPGITANLVSGNVQVSVTATGTGTGGFNFSNAAPATPTVGDRWLNSETLAQYVYINDGDSSQWVEPITRAVSSNLTNVSTHILPNSNVTYDLGSSSLRWRDLYLSGNSIILGGATLTASGSAIALPAGSTVGGQNLATGSDVSTGGGPKITNLQVTSNVYVVLDDTAVDTVGGFIKLTGTNFVTGCMVYVGTVPANSTTFVNSTEVRAQLPATAAGTYPVYVVNPDGGTAIRVPGVTFSASPAWQTASNLGEQYDGVLLNLSVVATDATSYTLVSGSLPPGLALNSNSGVISGTVTGVTNDTVYSFTINAVDPQLQDSPRTFTVTITVSDPYFKLTTLLLSGSAVSANTVVRDSSTNNFNLTVYGDARASNFTPYGTGWSVYFDGTGDLLSGTITGGVGSGDFTLEYWVYHNTLTDWQTHFATTRGVTGFNVGTDATGDLVFYDNVGGTGGRRIEVIGAITVNRWYHFAFSRSGTSLRGFLDGTLRGTYTTSQDYSATAFYIGALDTTQEYTNGYISNLRLVKGSALYTANFTPATTNLTTVANTSLLTCNVNRFRDSGANNFAITRNGDARVVSFNPFNITNTGVDGSMYFDGTGDYVTAPSDVAFAFGTGNFTVEAWVYWSGSASTFQITGSSSDNFNIYFNTTSLTFYNGATDTIISGLVINKFSWNHIALVRISGTAQFYLNGLAAGSSFASSTNWSTAIQFSIGRNIPVGTGYADGYISNLRVIKGTGLYTTTFTPPTSPLTAIANTQLLTLQYDQPHNNHTFLDSSSNQFVVTRSGNASQGTFSPFSQTGWSYYFDGNGDQLTSASTANLNLNLNNNWTIEGWFYKTGSFGNTGNFMALGTGGSALYWQLAVGHTGGAVTFGAGTGGWNWTTSPVGASSAINLNQWHHVAYVRNGASTLLIFIDGTVRYTNTSYNFGSATQGGTLFIGSYFGNHNNDGSWFSGYVSNLRIVNGQSLYTSNFTPSTSSLTTTSQGAIASNVTLLTSQSNCFIDNSASARTLARSGDISVQAFSPFAPTAVYSPVIHGGSAYFDGTGDYCLVSDSPLFSLAAADFTIESWIYKTVSGRSEWFGQCDSAGTSASASFDLQVTAGGKLSCGVFSGATSYFATSTADFPLNSWTHVVLCRDGTTIRQYINGVQDGTSSIGTASVNDASTNLGIGRLGDFTSNYLTGYMSSTRIIRGQCLYPSGTTFTPPTAPLTATINTSLLLNFTDAAILDSTGRNVIETVADAKTSSVVTKFTGGSMLFDGNGDNLAAPTTPNLNMGTGDWTIECWVYILSRTLNYPLIFGNNNGSYAAGALALTNSNADSASYNDRFFLAAYDVATPTLVASSTNSLNTWYHLALVRNGTNLVMYRDGISVASRTITSSITFDWGKGGVRVGGGNWDAAQSYFNGYIQDLRVTRGYARYTANFTAPTIPARLK